MQLMKESTCGHRGPENNWKERTGCLPSTAALWASWENSVGKLPSVPCVARTTLFLSVCQVVKAMPCQSSLWSASWVLPQAVTFRGPLYASRPHKAGKTARKNQHRCISCSENWEVKSNPPALGNSLLSVGRNGSWLQQTSAPRLLPQNWEKQWGWSNYWFLLHVIEISLFSRAD